MAIQKTAYAVIMHSDEMQDSVLLFKTFNEAVSCIIEEYNFSATDTGLSLTELRQFLHREQYVRIGSWDYTIQKILLPENL